ncbi:Ivy family c-type lysozyme inhibitor [Bosea sp. 117]|uniref:Ivy family c-type lysozyme inhibitor n=1 Tax=Bosea sp. 117 TaxID=1125973 RepID=UPI000B21454C|nr:Ivy family c-type lysozyme inhibitor [Bosea sp. 117]
MARPDLCAGVVALALFALAVPARAQDPSPAHDKPLLYELVAREPYRTTWHKLVAPVLKNERWLRSARGVWEPTRTVTVDGARFDVYFLCKPTACATNEITVIFESGGHHAAAAFRSPAGTQLLGAPGDRMRRALLSALH